jgi:hypothetical protein
MQTFKLLVVLWLCALALAFSLSMLHEYFGETAGKIVYAGLTWSLAALFLGTVFVGIRGLFRLARRQRAPADSEFH